MKSFPTCATLSAAAMILALANLQSAGAGIIVNLGKLVIEAGPDHRTTRELEIANTNEKAAEVTVFASDWTQDENGAVEAVDPAKEKAADSATAWIGVNPQRFTLNSGERKTVTVSIATPKTAAEMPLKEYRTMIFTETSDSRKSEASTPGRELQVRVIGRIGTKVFLRNPQGSAKLDCEVTKMEPVTREGKRGLSIQTQNNGNVHIQSDNSSIAFRDSTGATVETFPLPAFSVLPGQLRTIVFNLPEPGKSKLKSGEKYNALAVIDYGGSDLVAGEIELTY